MLRLFFPTNELEEQSDDEDNFEDNNGDDEDDSKSRPSEWGLARITSPVSLHPPPIDFETGIKECLKSASSPDEEGKDEGREENRRGSFFDLGKLLGNQVGALDLSIYNPKLPPPEEAEEVPLMEEKTKGGSNLPWILHVHQSKDITFESGDGLNVYVDAARFLPENVFLSRVSAVVMREGGSVIVPYVGEGKSHSKATDWAGCSLSGSRLSPTFNLRVEYREDRFDPTAFLLIILACVDRKGTYHHVGVSTINLFYSSESKNRFETPPDPNIGEYCLNEGAFQLPIRYAWPEEDEKFVIEAYEKLERIPCATVLMRIEKAKKSLTGYGLASVFSSRLRPSQKDALITPAPNYGSKTYDSTRCKPDKNEQLCYGNIPKKLSKTKIRDTARALSRFYKFEDEMGDDDEKDNGSKKNERYFQKFVKKSLVKESGRLHSDFPMINPYRMRRFIAEVGFSVSIDGLENLNIRNSELAIVIYSLSPPSPFYNEDPTLRIAEDVEFTTKWDMSSVTNKPRFETGWFRFKEVEHSNELLLVIDVRALDTRKSNSLDGASADEETCEACLRPLGWGVLPIFDRDAQSEELLRESKVKFNLPDDREDDGKNNETSSAFVTAGNFQVPLFEGAVDRTTLDEIASISGEEGFDAAIRHVLVAKGKEVLRRRAKGEGGVTVHPNYSSAFVRICDSQIQHFAPEAGTLEFDESLLSGEHFKRNREKFKVKRSGGFFSGSPTSLRALAGGKDVNLVEWRRNTLRVLMKATGIDHYYA